MHNCGATLRTHVCPYWIQHRPKTFVASDHRDWQTPERNHTKHVSIERDRTDAPQFNGPLFHVGGGMSGGMTCKAEANGACNNPAPTSKLDDVATKGATKPAAARPLASLLNSSNLFTTTWTHPKAHTRRLNTRLRVKRCCQRRWHDALIAMWFL